jgi:N-acetylmuramoyl-L-alanine amidase
VLRQSRKISALATLAVGIFLLATMQIAFAQVVAWGSQGDQVSTVQKKLKQWGYYDGSVTGYFGQDTYNAVVLFQRKNGLKADGVVGATTAAALGITLTGGAVSVGSFNESEVYTLARLINGEARGEPYIGQVAVGAVVLNRVKSPSFPNTISGVVYQPGAFDAVIDGQVNLPPGQDSIRAARDAMNGWDPTGGALYYYNPATATSNWIWTRQITLSIGRHNFAI